MTLPTRLDTRAVRSRTMLVLGALVVAACGSPSAPGSPSSGASATPASASTAPPAPVPAATSPALTSPALTTAPASPGGDEEPDDYNASPAP